MNAKRILLTGATSIAGRQVLAELIGRNCQVLVLEPKPVNLQGCSVVVSPWEQIARHATEIGQADAIIHLASSHSLEQDAALKQIAGTSALIDARGNSPFVYVSSIWLEADSDVPPRQTPIGSSNWYLMEKYCNEFQLRLAPPNKGPAVVLRPGLLFSPGSARDDRQYLNLIYERCKSGSRFAFRSERGLQSFGASFIGSADFARGVAEALTLNSGGVFNVASGFCTWRDLIETINHCAGTKAKFAVRRDGVLCNGEFMLPQSRRCLDTSAFKAQTGFVPQQRLEELIEDFVRAEQTSTPKSAKFSKIQEH